MMEHQPLNTRMNIVPITTDGGALNFDLGKNQVQSFLISSLKFWLMCLSFRLIRRCCEQYALSWLRYGPWTPNIDGGNSTTKAFISSRRLNAIISRTNTQMSMIAEESSHGQKITGPEEEGGLTDYKWIWVDWNWYPSDSNEEDPIYRKFDFNLVTFSFMAYFLKTSYYHFHMMKWYGKKSLMHKMWGDVTINLLDSVTFTYQICHPGKKLLLWVQNLVNFWNGSQKSNWNGAI